MTDRIWLPTNGHNLNPSAVRAFKTLGVTFCVAPDHGVLDSATWQLLGVEVHPTMVEAKPTIVVSFDIVPSNDLMNQCRAVGAQLWTWIHPEAHPDRIQHALKIGLKMVGLDVVLNERGERIFSTTGLTCRNAARYGVALASPKTLTPRTVMLGAGHTAAATIKELYHHGVVVETPPKNGLREWLIPRLPEIDLLFNGIDLPSATKGLTHIVTRADVATMKPGSVIVDLTVDYAGLGPIETLRPTYGDHPAYVEEGVVHACYWGWPHLTMCEADSSYFLALFTYYSGRQA